jgi:hypothetical protein
MDIFKSFVRSGVFESRKGDLVISRLNGKQWSHGSVGVVLASSSGLVDEATTTAVLETGVILRLPSADFHQMFMTLAHRHESMFVLCYGISTMWQIEEDFQAGHFNLGFEAAKAQLRLLDLARARPLQTTRKQEVLAKAPIRSLGA